MTVRHVAEAFLLEKMREMPSVTSFQLKTRQLITELLKRRLYIVFLRMKRGVRFGVCIPRALLAITPLSGVLSGAFEYR